MPRVVRAAADVTTSPLGQPVPRRRPRAAGGGGGSAFGVASSTAAVASSTAAVASSAVECVRRHEALGRVDGRVHLLEREEEEEGDLCGKCGKGRGRGGPVPHAVTDSNRQEEEEEEGDLCMISVVEGSSLGGTLMGINTSEV